MKGFSNQANNTSKVENFTQWLEEIIGLRQFEINVLLELHLFYSTHMSTFAQHYVCMHVCVFVVGLITFALKDLVVV